MPILANLARVTERQLPQTRRLAARQDPIRATPDAEFGPGYLKQMLRRQDSVGQEVRIGGEYLHVSSLIDLCQRKHRLAEGDPTVLSDKVTGGHKVMWRLGRAAERHVRDGIIADRGRVGVLGIWRCLCRRTEQPGLYSPSYRPCPHCKGPLEHYKELPLFDETAKVVGNPDLMLYVGREVLCVEIKSIKADAWDKLDETKPNGALPDHKFQAHAYRRLAEHNGYRVLPIAAVLYVTKDFKWGEPYKEFHTTLEHTTANVLDMAWGEAMTLRQHRAMGTMPARTMCQAITTSRAKQCPVAATCFMRSAS